MFTISRTGHALLRLAGGAAIMLLLVAGWLVGNAHPVAAAGLGEDLFTVTAFSYNTTGDSLLLDDPVSNGNPNALVFVTANDNPLGESTGFDNHQVGVWYDAVAARWGIFNEDGAPMPLGAAFNVLVFPGPTSVLPAFVQVVTTANRSGDTTVINNPALNENPFARLLVTQNLDPGGIGFGFNNHAIGVWYNSQRRQWTIYNEDRSPLNSGVSFNVVVMRDSLTQVATPANTASNATCVNSNGVANNNPQALLFITHVSSGFFSDVSAVWYNSFLAEWCVIDGSGSAMPIGTTFFVVPIANLPT